MRGPLVLLLALVAVLQPVRALAWSELGHRLVGDLAGQQLTAQAGAEVRRLLAGEAEPTLGGVASWADALRNADPARFRATSRWHYINARGGGCGFDVARDCPDGQCVVAAIQQQRRLLADASQPLAVRREALKFLVHLVGDIHQPLHAGSRTDSGGNRFQVSLTTALAPEAHASNSHRNGVMGTNLHAVWDYYVLASAGLERGRYAARLRGSMPSLPASVAQAAPPP